MTTGTDHVLGVGEERVEPDEADVMAGFIKFLKEASARRKGTGPVRRFNQARASGCVKAELVVPEGLEADLRVGLFATPRTYPAWIRFGNATSDSDRERDIRGMSIKVSGVAGENLTPGSNEQDFILISHPVMVAANSRDFLELLKANEAGGLERIGYFATHLKAANIGRSAQQRPTCHLDIPYWSTVPFRFGDPGTAVKFAVRPTSARTSEKPKERTDDYLQAALRRHLAKSDATFDVFVQFQKDGKRTPIEDATEEWKEHDAPFRRVAEIRIPQQAIDNADVVSRCEPTAFNPWNGLVEHRPLGSMNRARGEIYRAMAAFRAASRG
jgi:hypothetical protein